MGKIPADTTFEAFARQLEIVGSMSAQDRLEMAFEVSEDLSRIVEAGVRHRHPEYEDEKVRLEVIRLTIGDRLFKEAFGKAAGGR
jgi:hypothetical protein